jgi:hypothetical protein
MQRPAESLAGRDRYEFEKFFGTTMALTLSESVHPLHSQGAGDSRFGEDSGPRTARLLTSRSGGYFTGCLKISHSQIPKSNSQSIYGYHASRKPDGRLNARNENRFLALTFDAVSLSLP